MALSKPKKFFVEYLDEQRSMMTNNVVEADRITVSLKGMQFYLDDVMVFSVPAPKRKNFPYTYAKVSEHVI